MTNIEIIHNAATDEIVEIEIDPTEMTRRETEAKKAEELRKQQEDQKLAAKKALLDRLGISEEEALVLFQ